MPQTFGPYIVEELIAHGSSGVVYRARHGELQRVAAIKELSPEVRGVPGQVDRLRAEAATLASLDHPNLVEVYDYVEEDDGAWIAEQWVDGASLQEILDAHGALTSEQALGVVRGAVMGLGHAHERGIVHRDVSTANILADDDGTSMLVDFGIAAPAGTGNAVGTPAFLSPEAAAGEPLTKPSDVYSAAAVLYLLLTGQPVFGGTLAQAVEGHRHTPAPVLTGHGTELADLIARSLSKSPGDRPPDAAQFLIELEHGAAAHYGSDWLKGSSIAGMAGIATKGRSAIGLGSQTAAGGAASGASMGTVAAAIAAVAVAVAAAVGLAIAFTGNEDSSPSARRSSGPSPAPQSAPPSNAPDPAAPESPATQTQTAPIVTANTTVNASQPNSGGNTQPVGGGGGPPPPPPFTDAEVIAFNTTHLSGMWTIVNTIISSTVDPSRVGQMFSRTIDFTAECFSVTECFTATTNPADEASASWTNGVLALSQQVELVEPCFPSGTMTNPDQANLSASATPIDSRVASGAYSGEWTYQIEGESLCGVVNLTETRQVEFFKIESLAAASAQIEVAIASAIDETTGEEPGDATQGEPDSPSGETESGSSEGNGNNSTSVEHDSNQDRSSDTSGENENSRPPGSGTEATVPAEGGSTSEPPAPGPGVQTSAPSDSGDAP